MTSTAYRLTSTLLLLAAALMLLAAEAFGAPNFRSAKIRANVPVVSSGYYTLPEANQTAWQANVIQGIPGGIPARTTHVTNAVTAFSADNTGATATQAAIVNALAASPSNGAVLLPTGRYRIDGSIGVYSGVTVRGAGMTNTILSNTVSVFSADVDSSSTWNNIYKAHDVTAGLTNGSTNLSVTWNPTMYPFGIGHAIMIGAWCSSNQNDNPLYMNLVGEFNTNSIYSMPLKSIHVCTSTNATGLTFWPPLPFNYPTNYNGRVAPHSTAPGGAGYSRRTMFGLEDLTLDYTGSSVTEGINWIGVENCWLKNVRILFPQNRAVYIANAHNVEVRGCELQMSPAVAANHAGLELDLVSFGLYEDNFIKDAFPGIQNNGGIAGIFGYNFIWRNDSYDVIVGNHGTVGHSARNLYEGNIANRSKVNDGYFGSASGDVYFRNHLHAANSNNAAADAIVIKRFTRGTLLLANVFGKTNQTVTYPMLGEPFGSPNTGNTNYTIPAAPPWADWLLGGKSTADWQELDGGAAPTIAGCYNYFSNAVDSSLGGLLTSNSLYLSAQPSFVYSWPFVVPSSPSVQWTNTRSGARWTNGFWN